MKPAPGPASRAALCLALAVLAVLAGCGGSPFLCASPPVARVQGPFVPKRLAFYLTHHDAVWSLRDPGFVGFSEFARELRRSGFAPVEFPEGPTQLQATESWRDWADGRERGPDIAILNVGRDFRPSAVEARALLDFVQRGGGLLILGEHDNMFGIADALGPVLGPPGLRLGRDAVGSRQANVRLADSPYFRLNNIVEMLSASVHGPVGSGDVLLRSPSGVTLGLGVPFGKGRVALLGDSELFWNGDGRIGIDAGQNRRFLSLLFAYLGGPSGTPSLEGKAGDAPARHPEAYTFGRGPRRACFDTQLGLVQPEAQPDGLSRFATALASCGFEVHVGAGGAKRLRSERCLRSEDLLIVAAPVQAISPPEPVSLPPSGRLLVLAGARYELTEANYWDRVLLHRGAEPRPHPYTRLESQLGFEFVSCVQTEKHRLRLTATHPPGASVYRAGGLRLLSSAPRPRAEALRPWNGLRLSDAARCVPVHPGLPGPSQASAEPLPVALVSDRALLVADVHAFTDRHKGTPAQRELFAAVFTWAGGCHTPVRK